MKRLQHLLQRTRIHVHVFRALRFVALATGDLMLMHDVLVIILRARSRARRDGSLDSHLLVLQCSSSLCTLRLGSLLAQRVRLLVARIVLVDLQSDVILLRVRTNRLCHRTRIGFLTLQYF